MLRELEEKMIKTYEMDLMALYANYVVIGGRRNLEIAIGVIGAIIIVWAGWSLWWTIIPGLFWASAFCHHIEALEIRKAAQNKCEQLNFLDHFRKSREAKSA